MLCQPEMAPQAIVTNMIGQMRTNLDVEPRVGRQREIGMEYKNSDDPEEETKENDVRRNIVDRECKPPDGQHCGEIAEDEAAIVQNSLLVARFQALCRTEATVPRNMPSRAISTQTTV